MDDREKIIFESLETDDWDLFVAAIETTDRISHMMWRLIDPKHPMYDEALAAKYGDSIEKVYRRADDLVGRLRQKVPKDAVFMVMSDHGFHSFRREVNLNTWLVQNGYMSFEGQEGGRRTCTTCSAAASSWRASTGRRPGPTPWASGRSTSTCGAARRKGIVSAGAEYKALQDEIRAEAAAAHGPRDRRARSSRDVYKRDDIYKGEYLQIAPDLQVGFNDGYRVGWQDTLGAIRRGVVENNNRKWSGDHCATATEISGGVFFCNRKIATADAEHHGPRAHDPEAARDPGPRRTWTASRSCEGPRSCVLALAGAPQDAPAGEPAPAGAARASDEERLKKVQERRAALEQELARLRGEEKSLLGEVERLELELRLRERGAHRDPDHAAADPRRARRHRRAGQAAGEEPGRGAPGARAPRPRPLQARRHVLRAAAALGRPARRTSSAATG